MIATSHQPKRFLKVLGLLLFLSSPFLKAEKNELFSKLMGERQPEAFKKLLSESHAAGENEQVLLEAEFLFNIDNGSDADIASLLPRFLKSRENDKIEQSNIFTAPEDRDATIEFVKALDASLRDDLAAFETHMKAAFWLNPERADTFAPYAIKVKTRKALEKILFVLDTKQTKLGDAATPSFKEILADKKALVLHYWTPWKAGAEESLVSFTTLVSDMKSQNIAIASVLPADASADPTSFSNILQEAKVTELAPWLIDTDNILSRRYFIKSSPTLLLIDKNGKILFHGSPDDKLFKEKLKMLD